MAKSAEPKAGPRKLPKVTIKKLPTGVQGLDDILGGGIPEFSFNLIGGSPGCGKTTLVHQLAFANATRDRPVLYFTVLGEPVIKMLRYQQQFSFYDDAKVGGDLRFINLSEAALRNDLTVVFEEIAAQVTAANPGVVVIDSFRSLARRATGEAGEMEIQAFIHPVAGEDRRAQATRTRRHHADQRGFAPGQEQPAGRRRLARQRDQADAGPLGPRLSGHAGPHHGYRPPL